MVARSSRSCSTPPKGQHRTINDHQRIKATERHRSARRETSALLVRTKVDVVRTEPSKRRAQACLRRRAPPLPRGNAKKLAFPLGIWEIMCQ